MIVNYFAKRSVVLSAAAMTIGMFVIVMFVVNPMIDGGDGLSVIALQLAFDKDKGEAIVNHWNVATFDRWIFTDYLYAASYTLFFSSLILWLMKTKNKSGSPYLFFIFAAVAAGVFDWIENTLELWFLHNPDGMPETLFWAHSAIASLKWLALPVVLIGIVLLLRKRRISPTWHMFINFKQY
jgi:hypothetical protein